MAVRLVGVEDADDRAGIRHWLTLHRRRERAVAERGELGLEAAAAVGGVEVRTDREARLEAVDALAPREDGEERLAVDDEPSVADASTMAKRARRRQWRRLGRRVRRRRLRLLVAVAREQDHRDYRRQHEPGRDSDVLPANSPQAVRSACWPRSRRAAERARRSGSGARAESVAVSSTSTAISGPVRQAACAASGRVPRFVRTQ